MIDDEKRQFAALMTGLGETYSKEVSKATMRIYWDALIRYQIGQVEDAVSKHIRSVEKGSFWPKPADLIAQIPRLRPEHQMAVTYQVPVPTGPDDYNQARNAVNRAYAMRCFEAAGNPGLISYPITYGGAFPVRQFVDACDTPHGNKLPENQAAWAKVWSDFDMAFNARQTWDLIRNLGEVAA